MKKLINPLRKFPNNPMRIAYITLHWPRTVSSSIGKKIQAQMREWRQLGHTVLFFSHLHDQKGKQELVDGNRFFYNTRLTFPFNELSRMYAAKRLLHEVRKYKPDIIYLRWGMYVHPMKAIFKIAPTFIEINTNDYEEHKLLGFIMDRYNRLTRSLLLKNAVGLVFTTNELAHSCVFTKFKKPYTVVSNGIDLENTPFYEAPKNTPPHLIFIGTPGMEWHGAEKLIDFAKEFPDIEVDIIGLESFNMQNEMPGNLHIHGYQIGDNYEEILSKADAAMATLALHMKGMQEAAPFKTRDCAARGIPCILPYRDTDLYDIKSDELINIPNTPDNILNHGALIHDFIIKMRGKRINRKIIEERIDIKSKEKNRIKFFEDTIKHIHDY